MVVPGTLFILSAPSGCGKTSLVGALLKTDPRILVSVSHTTRAPRAGEQDGVHYHFVDQKAFKELVDEAIFLEHAEVFGNHYGTSKHWVESQLKKGLDVILEIDWQGARRVRELMNSVSIFILPPSRKALVVRLQDRGLDDAGVIERRMQQASSEISHYDEYDYVVVNDSFDKALHDLKVIIEARRCASIFQKVRCSSLIRELLS